MKTFFDQVYIQSLKKATLRSKTMTKIPNKSLMSLKLTMHFTQSNIFAALYDTSNLKSLTTVSSGSVGFKGRMQKSKNAVFLILKTITRKIRAFPYRSLKIEIRGHSWLKRFLVRRFLSSSLKSNKRIKNRIKEKKFPSSLFSYTSSLKISHLTPFNGCRKTKPRN